MFTDLIGVSFRENPDFMRLAGRRLSNRTIPLFYPTDFVQLLTGQQSKPKQDVNIFSDYKK